MNEVTEAEEAETRNGTRDEIESVAMQEFREDLNHKLRTPLNAIIGFAELLSLQPGKRSDNDVQQILKSAREMLEIIERELAEPNGKAVPDASDAATQSTCDVLYVEDDPVNFTLVERILEFRPGLNVVHAPQGQLGVQFAEAYRPQLVLLDLNLPDMHGSEVLRQLRDSGATADIPVVILSANATPSQIERLLAAGAKNYLTKPFNIDHFLAVVDEFV
ncbi:MAG TPA: response regulator, partial [Chthoniobacterales bacterium]